MYHLTDFTGTVTGELRIAGNSFQVADHHIRNFTGELVDGWDDPASILEIDEGFVDRLVEEESDYLDDQDEIDYDNEDEEYEYRHAPARISAPFIFGDENIRIKVRAMWPDYAFVQRFSDRIRAALASQEITGAADATQVIDPVLGAPDIAIGQDNLELSDPRMFPALLEVVQTLTSDDVEVLSVTVTDSTGRPVDAPGIIGLIMPPAENTAIA